MSYDRSRMRRITPALGVVTLFLAALSLGPSYAHVLEAVPRLTVWSPELWREATVFNGQFEYFAVIGAPIDVLAIAFGIIMCFLVRRRRAALLLALSGTACLILALAMWVLLVEPMNMVLSRWTPGPIPPDFEVVRSGWETGHMVVTALKAPGFLCLATALLLPRRRRSEAQRSEV